MHRYLLLTTAILLLARSLFSQGGSPDFFILKSGPVPQDYIADPLKRATGEAKSQDMISYKDALPHYERSGFEIEYLINTGTIYVNDELTVYLEGLIGRLTEKQPELRDKLRILASRYTAANAYCFMDGTVIVNVGLLAKVENESQLIGILAHELTHYTKKHSLATVQRGKELQEQAAEIGSREGRRFLSLKYSREKEFEADAGAVTWLTQTSYDANELAASLELITAEQVDSLPTDFWEEFNTGIFKVDTAFISDKNVKKELKRSASKHKSFIKGEEESKHTHPDGEKRALAVREILKAIEYQRPSTPPDDARFRVIKHKAAFENCENLFASGSYLESLHQSLKLKRQLPDNLTAHRLTVKNLFWLCRLKESGVLGNLLQETDLEKSPSMARLKLFFDKTKSADLGKFLYSYVQREREQFKDDPDLLFYLAAAAEMHLGKDAAAIHYRSYSTKFPEGKFISFVNERIN